MSVNITFIVDCSAVSDQGTLANPTGLNHNSATLGANTDVVMVYQAGSSRQVGPVRVETIVPASVQDDVRISAVHAGNQAEYRCAIVKLMAITFGSAPPPDDPPTANSRNPVITLDMMNSADAPIDTPRFTSFQDNSFYLDFPRPQSESAWLAYGNNNGVQIFEDATVETGASIRVPQCRFDLQTAGYFQYRVEIKVAKLGQDYGYCSFDPWIHISP